MKAIHYRLLFFSTIVVLCFITCKKEHAPASNNPQPDSTQYIKPFSGTWHGYISVTDINPSLCFFNGDPISVTQTWKVKTDSTIKIDETYVELGTTIQLSHSWTGIIHHSDSITISSTRQINCFGVFHNMVITISDKIVRNGNKYNLSTSVDYPMCPPNCLFTFNYQMNQD